MDGYNPKDSKYRPPEIKERDSKDHGDAHDFNIKGKSINTEGSDYNDLGRKSSGLYGNFAEKDASMAYLRDRNKQGQMVQHFSGTERQSRLTTGGGVTAYDALPIPEVYQPATSNGPINPNAIVYKSEMKERQPQPAYEQDTESNKLTKDQTKHLKQK